MLDIHELRVFLAAAETENFSEAGRRLSISQPAVSMQIRSLEEKLELKLFHRTGRHITLTEAGHELMPLARDLIGRTEQVEESMASLRGSIVGLLRLGCDTEVGHYVLPTLIARLQRAHKQVHVASEITSTQDVLHKLLDGAIHIALTSHVEPYREIESQPFFCDRLVLIAPVDHPWGGLGQAVQPAALLDENVLLYAEDTPAYGALRAALLRHEISIDELNSSMVTPSQKAVQTGVQAGLGVGFVSSVIATEAVRCGQARVIEVSGLRVEYTCHLARHRKRIPTMAQEAFWQEAFAEAGKRGELPGQALLTELEYAG